MSNIRERTTDEFEFQTENIFSELKKNANFDKSQSARLQIKFSSEFSSVEFSRQNLTGLARVIVVKIHEKRNFQTPFLYVSVW